MRRTEVAAECSGSETRWLLIGKYNRERYTEPRMTMLTKDIKLLMRFLDSDRIPAIVNSFLWAMSFVIGASKLNNSQETRWKDVEMFRIASGQPSFCK